MSAGELIVAYIAGCAVTTLVLYLGFLSDKRINETCEEQGWQKPRPAWMIEAEKAGWKPNNNNAETK